jgi:hypothetical protein
MPELTVLMTDEIIVDVHLLSALLSSPEWT